MPLKNIDFNFSENSTPMWVVDPGSHQIVDVNNAALSLYGYNKEKMLSLTNNDLQSSDRDLDEDQNNEFCP